MLGNETAENNKLQDEDFSSVSVFEYASVILFYILFIIGGFLDIFVIYVMLRSGQVRKNISSFLIFHLSFTHLLFHVVFTLTIPGGPLRRNTVTVCKVSAFIEHACPASIFSTLVAIAWDRHKHVIQPFKSLVAKTVKSYLMITAVIWVYAVISSASFVHSATLEQDCRIENKSQQKCEEFYSCHTPSNWATRIAEVIYFLMAFIIPLSYMAVAYTRIAIRLWKRSKNGLIHSAVARHKTKSIRLLLIAVFGFVVCWGPGILSNFLAQFGIFDELSLEAEYVLEFWFLFIGPASSSCINTAIYTFLSPEFRKNCVKFGCRCCCSCRPFIQSCARNNRVNPDGLRMRGDKPRETTTRLGAPGFGFESPTCRFPAAGQGKRRLLEQDCTQVEMVQFSGHALK